MIRRCSLLALTALSITASAHELQDNRATLVLRDQTHISVTLYLSYCEALHLALAPDRPLPEFMMVYSTMSPDRLQRAIGAAQSRFQSATRLYLAAGKELSLSNWVFPDVKQVQSALQRWIMQAMAEPGGHFHEEPLEIHAEAQSPEPVTSVRIQFPEEFQKVLVVAYRPNQLWVEPKSWSPVIKF